MNTSYTKKLVIPVSSSLPFFTLRWLQNATLATPTLFINDINIIYKGNGKGNQGHCSLDDFTNSNE